VRKRGLAGDFWPSSRQELLLRAALLDGRDAVGAWEQLRPELDIDTLEEGGFALLPLVYRRLREAEVEDPELPRLRGIYRHTWSRNQLALDELTGLVRHLANAGVAAAPIRGVSTLVRYYSELGLRPIPEFELFVPEEDASAAVRAVGRLGWAPADPDREAVAEGWPALRLRGPQGGRTFVLHWRLLPEFEGTAGPGASAELWERMEPLMLGDEEMRALAPEDELLHTCLTGARSTPFTNLQWIADATLTVRATPQLDWERVLAGASRRRAELRLRDALTYLRRAVDPPVPPEVMTSLAAVRPTTRDRLAHRVAASGGKVAGEFPRALSQYIRATAGSGSLRTVVGVPAFLRETWKLDHTWEVPLHAVRKGVRGLVRRRHPQSA
jgi:putative nucleotidyltransferase-like protein